MDNSSMPGDAWSNRRRTALVIVTPKPRYNVSRAGRVVEGGTSKTTEVPAPPPPPRILRCFNCLHRAKMALRLYVFNPKYLQLSMAKDVTWWPAKKEYLIKLLVETLRFTPEASHW